jgi:Na+-transporting NADH:ubiquinone oxidoreductase subunit F
LPPNDLARIGSLSAGGFTGFIRDVVHDQHLNKHPNPQTVEYQLYGPVMMIRACGKMLGDLGGPDSQIGFDEF